MTKLYVSETLLDTQEVEIEKGPYAFSVSGAMVIHWDLDNGKGFVPFTGSTYTEATDEIKDLPRCTIKVTAAGGNDLFIADSH